MDETHCVAAGCSPLLPRFERGDDPVEGVRNRLVIEKSTLVCLAAAGTKIVNPLQ